MWCGLSKKKSVMMPFILRLVPRPSPSFPSGRGPGNEATLYLFLFVWYFNCHSHQIKSLLGSFPGSGVQESLGTRLSHSVTENAKHLSSEYHYSRSLLIHNSLVPVASLVVQIDFVQINGLSRLLLVNNIGSLHWSWVVGGLVQFLLNVQKSSYEYFGCSDYQRWRD